MGENNIAFFLPTRRGSQRVFNKNTRPFSHFKGGLLENKLTQLLKSKNISEIILSTNDEECLRIAEPFAKENDNLIIDRRPESLCLDTTDLEDLIQYVPTVTRAKHILWGHTTTPIVDSNIYDHAINKYFECLETGYDSLVSVLRLQNFLLNKKIELINNNTGIRWPRTQDLTPLYEINHAIFIASREIYLTTKNRLGNDPFLYEMSKINSVDIDWEEDFEIAEIIYNYVYR